MLTASKGAGQLCQHLSGIEHTLDGEWVPARDEFYAFDLPDRLLNYDERRSELARILNVNAVANFDPPLIDGAAAISIITSMSRVRLVASYTVGRFPQVYEGLKGHGAEGVVLKRRRALYAKHMRPGVESRDWLKRRFGWDQPNDTAAGC